MSVQASTMTHAYTLVEDWLSLEHWSAYGTSERDYQLQHGVPVGVGQALWIGEDGPLRIARDTDITPGVPHVLTVPFYCGPGGTRPCNLQVRDVPGSHYSHQNILNVDSPLSDGWNRVVVNFTPSPEWSAVRLALFTTVADGGLIGPIRALPAENGEG